MGTPAQTIELQSKLDSGRPFVVQPTNNTFINTNSRATNHFRLSQVQVTQTSNQSKCVPPLLSLLALPALPLPLLATDMVDTNPPLLPTPRSHTQPPPPLDMSHPPSLLQSSTSHTQ